MAEVGEAKIEVVEVEAEAVENEEVEGGKRWPTRTGFLLAAAGSAMGLGNVWRFPYMAYKYGGGAFLIPYIIALFTTGIPLLALEMGIGKNMQKSPPFAFLKMDKRFGWLGWFMLFVNFIIVAYYTVIIGWSVVYMGKSLTLSWGSTPEQHFYGDFIGQTAGPGALGGIDIGLLVALVGIWALMFWIVLRGVDRVSKVVKLTVPLPALLLVVLGIRSLTLPGASIGLEYYLSPNMAALADPEVWLAAYAQVFFTLSLAGGTMIAYASRLPKDSDTTNNAHIVSLTDAGLAFFAGLVVFSTLGYLSFSTGNAIENVVGSGPALPFIVYPTAISLLPAGAAFFGFLFFLMLFLLGIDSAFAILEAVVMGFREAGFNRVKVLKVATGVGIFASIFFSTGGGYHWLAIVDQFFNEIGLILIGILECLVVAYFFGPGKMANLCNRTSEVKLGEWWKRSIMYVTPIILTLVLVARIGESILYGYSGYPNWAILLGGWLPLFLLLGGAAFLWRRWMK
jgi:NSS family neurotransmitter:Na+ symporter